MLATTIKDFVNPGEAARRDPDFPDAPDGWSTADAKRIAEEDGIVLSSDHWEVIRVLQGAYKDEAQPRIRTLCTAMKGRFKAKGGIEYVYELFPAGPLTQGCKLAGLTPPPETHDAGAGTAP